MNEPDELQQVWQQESYAKEKPGMWMQLVSEKRSDFRELLKAENRTEYIVVLTVVPLLCFGIWRTPLPLVRAGYGLIAAAVVGLAFAIWIAYRPTPQRAGGSVSEELRDLIGEYEARIRFLRRAAVYVSLGIATGLLIGVAEMRLPTDRVTALAGTCVIVALFCWGQWVSFRRRRASLLEKRQRALELLREVQGGGSD